MRDFHTLDIWKRSYQLTLQIYDLTNKFPEEEKFALKSQMHRAAYSIPCNIAEGCGREKSNDMRLFVQYAIGSSNELETQLLLAHDLGYIDQTTCEQLINEVTQLRRMIISFRRTL